MKYRSKPKIVDAEQWTGKNYAEIVAFVGDHNMYWDGKKNELGIDTLECLKRIQKDEYIIKDAQG